MMALTDASGTLSSFAGATIDNWAIQRAARQWGLFHPGPPQGSGGLVDQVLGEGTSSLFERGPKKVLSAAHVEALEVSERSIITNAPQEEGNFTSYNKVFQPYGATIRFICDGSETGSIGENLLPGFLKGVLGNGPDSVRRDFAATLAALVKDTNLYFVATPERIYRRANVVGYSFSRKPDRGVDMIVADVRVQEVRSTGKTGWVTTRHPQGARKRDNGYVQAGEPQVGDLY